MRAFLRRKTIYFLSENGSSKPSPRISHFQLELDKLPYVITRLKPICHRWNAVSQLGKCLTCCTASQRCLKGSQSLSYSHPRPTHTLRQPRTPPAAPRVLCIPLFSPFLSFFKAWPAFLNFLFCFFSHTLTPFSFTPKHSSLNPWKLVCLMPSLWP